MGKCDHEPYGEGEGVRGRVLVVDDDARIGRFVRRILTATGYGVTLARDVGCAWTSLGEAPDVLLCDVAAPGRERQWFVSEVRARFRRLPIVVTSGREENLSALVRRGATAFVPKPFHPDDLVDVVGTALSESARRIPVATITDAWALSRQAEGHSAADGSIGAVTKAAETSSCVTVAPPARFDEYIARSAMATTRRGSVGGRRKVTAPRLSVTPRGSSCRLGRRLRRRASTWLAWA